MELRDEIAFAFSKVPRPADSALTSCNCDECRWEVRGLRGKTWARLSLGDWGEGDGVNIAMLAPAAFHYFLPGLLRLALDHPDELPMLPSDVVSRLVVSDREREDVGKRVDRLLRLLSPRQRHALIEFFRIPGVAKAVTPVILDSVLSNLMDGAATPYSFEALKRWNDDLARAARAAPPDGRDED